MDLTMSIANTVSYMKQTELMQNISFKVLDKALDTESAQAEQLIKNMSDGAASFGHLLDTYA
ncbi:MAG: YjfB family protein [Oscillospiraceae bacterium]